MRMISLTKKELFLLSLVVLNSFCAEKKENKYMRLYNHVINQQMPSSMNEEVFTDEILLQKELDPLIKKISTDGPLKIYKTILAKESADFNHIFSPHNILIYAWQQKTGTHNFFSDMLSSIDSIMNSSLSVTERQNLTKNLLILKKNLQDAKPVLKPMIIPARPPIHQEPVKPLSN
jgi:hypothetical protein